MEEAKREGKGERQGQHKTQCTDNEESVHHTQTDNDDDDKLLHGLMK